jgi:hypothetical protein
MYTFSTDCSAIRSSALVKMRTTPSLAPLMMSPLGIAATHHTDVAGCKIVCTHSPSKKSPYCALKNIHIY